ncbi:MAG: hypothetical protein F6J87_08580 [Spirulina sp. SIO3F2]|nr:hypothetical protein [Spirulina sp. SIO3F2]
MMKITFPHSELLQASYGTRSALITLIAGSLVTGFGIFVMLKYAKVTQLDCDRTPNNIITCQWQEQGILQTRREPIVNLTALEVEVNENNVFPLYRLHLVMERGEMPLMANYTDNANTIQRLGGQINAFITDSSQTQLTVRFDRRWFGYGMGGILSVIGLFGLYNALWRPCVYQLRVDRRHELISVEYRSLILHRRTHHYLMQDVRAVTSHRFAWDGQEQISLLMNSGEFLTLTLPEQADDAARQKIQGFLQSASKLN